MIYDTDVNQNMLYALHVRHFCQSSTTKYMIAYSIDRLITTIYVII